MSLPTAELFTIPRARPVAARRTATTGVAGRTPPRGAQSGAAPDAPGARDTTAAVGSAASAPPVRVEPAPPPARAVVTLLEAARDELRAAQAAADPSERFRSAHLGALRAAAAVLALRARSKRSSRPTDAWTLLGSVAPEYAEWAAFFAAHSATRSVVEAGVRGRVTQREADDMVRQADLFLALVTRTVVGRAAHG